MVKKKKSSQLLEGDVLEGGSALDFHTGAWRSQRPQHDRKRCTDCLLCWIHCPDAAIKVKDGKFVGIDLRYCKGCGICAKICPVRAIQMKKENGKNT